MPSGQGTRQQNAFLSWNLAISGTEILSATLGMSPIHSDSVTAIGRHYCAANDPTISFYTKSISKTKRRKKS